MKSDIEIAREVSLRKIKEVATSLGIPREEVQNYGRYIAKVPLHLIDEEKIKEHNLILVTAITPTKAGIGKTTVSIGLALGLNKIGKKAVAALREPSLGPCFGMKGGAAGGGIADGKYQLAFHRRLPRRYIRSQYDYSPAGQLYLPDTPFLRRFERNQMETCTRRERPQPA